MIEINLFWIVTLGVVLAGLFLLKELIYKGLQNKSLNITTNKDIEITKIFTSKFPLVQPAFMTKSAKEQNIENNQEIHELNKKIEVLDSRIHAQNANINKLVAMIEEISKNG